VRFWNTAVGVRRGFISRIGLKLGAFWPMAFIMCYMFAPGFVASATKQAGDSVKQLVMRTAQGSMGSYMNTSLAVKWWCWHISGHRWSL